MGSPVPTKKSPKHGTFWWKNNMRECYRVLVSLKSWQGQLLSLNPCLRPKILTRMLFLGDFVFESSNYWDRSIQSTYSFECFKQTWRYKQYLSVNLVVAWFHKVFLVVYCCLFFVPVESKRVQAVLAQRSLIKDLVLLRNKLVKWSFFGPFFTQKSFFYLLR